MQKRLSAVAAAEILEIGLRSWPLGGSDGGVLNDDRALGIFRALQAAAGYCLR